MWASQDGQPLTDFEKGFVLLLTVILFPIWILPYLIYKVIELIGSNIKQEVKEEEVEIEYYY